MELRHNKKKEGGCQSHENKRSVKYMKGTGEGEGQGKRKYWRRILTKLRFISCTFANM